jgi:UDP-4-amino-4,6-dideoxy-N-acetyl-beta-L-altrosamine transaminase
LSGFLPYARQDIDDADVQAVVEVLRSEWLTQGPQVEAFEQELAAVAGARFAVVMCNGSAALHAAYHAAGLGPGQVCLTTPITFPATANAALYLGAGVDFADVEPDTALIDPQAVARAIGPATRVLAPVHMAGQPADLPALRALADSVGALVVEDAAHALGSEYFDTASGEWARVGSCRHSHMTVFSFHPAKHVAMGEGGAVTTNDPELAERLRRFRDHGLVRDPALFEEPDPGPWHREMHSLGMNYRASDLHCALGRSQLRRLPKFVQRRREIATRYDEAFADHPATHPLTQRDTARSSYHLYVVQLDADRRRVVEELRARNIGAHVLYPPVHLHPWYRKERGFAPGAFPAAERYYARALTLPLFPAMSDADVERVVVALLAALADAA